MALHDPAPPTIRPFREPERASHGAAAASGLALEEVIGRGQRRLNFPPALEAEFEADTVGSRRRLLIICGMIGMAGIWFGTDIVVKMVPETAELTILTQYLLLAMAVVSQAVSWSIPKTRWKSQYFEFITTLNTMVVGAVAVWGTSMSQRDGIFTHSAVVIGVVMYAGIAARQRFRWTFASSTLTFIGYCLFTKANTPLQQLIVHGNILMLALGLALTLAASYGFEFRERRAWLLRQQSRVTQASLTQASEQLRELSVRDPLTGLHNRRHFDTALDQAFVQAKAPDQAVAMLMIDVDFFKRYNDCHGHPAGDACLKAVAKVLYDIALAHDGVVGRLGGEEFGMLLPGRSTEQALTVGQQVCEAVRAAGIEHRGSPVASRVTVSVGAAAVGAGQGASPHGLVQATDRALYRAKDEGRDRVLACAEGVPLQVEAPVVQPPSRQVDVPSSVQGAEEIKALNRVLARGLRWLFFPKSLEAIYQRQNLEERKRHLIMASVLGVLTLNAYTFASQAMYPDVASEVIEAVFVLGLVIIVAVGGSAFITMKAWVRESLYALGTSVVSVILVKALAQSQAFTVFGYAVALFLVPMFACVVARQPFWFALVPTLVTIGSLALFKPGTELERLVMEDTATIVINATIYTLIAAYTLEHGARKEWLLNRISLRQHEELEATTRHLHELSVSDPLTGLSNRRQFEVDFGRIWAERAATHQSVGLLIVDVDFFKNYNDRHGHPAGDRCLQQIARILSELATRERGSAARLGGEEFAILLPGRTLAQTLRVGQQACEDLRHARIEHGFSASVPWVTLSAGAASLEAGASDGLHGLLKSADCALYQAKSAGRNRVGPVDSARQAQALAPAG
ncbi:diguanylate cyclase [Aquabacterium sp.]|uniref:diguanylate cyclase n=1 Tax=Aquabacterium sp. TaxID=1872578 RepID=UPI003D6DA41D